MNGIQFSVSPGNCWDNTLYNILRLLPLVMHKHPVIRRHVPPAVEKALLNNRNIVELINQTLLGAASHTIVNSSYPSPTVVLIRYPCQGTIRANKSSMVHENRTNELQTSNNSRQGNHDSPVLQRIQVGTETKPQSNGYIVPFSQKCSGQGVS